MGYRPSTFYDPVVAHLRAPNLGLLHSNPCKRTETAPDPWERHQYDFTGMLTLPHCLLYTTANIRKDALGVNWEGLVAGTDGSVGERAARMGAGYAIGDQPIPIRVFLAPVGGPLASIRPEAASLLQIRVLRDVAGNYDHSTPLLIFVDCLVLFSVLSKWGRHDLHPNPKDSLHFDISSPPYGIASMAWKYRSSEKSIHFLLWIGKMSFNSMIQIDLFHFCRFKFTSIIRPGHSKFANSPSFR
jgi:hypothetical protein